MKKEDIHLLDWQRILFGDTPAEFTVEVVVRTLLIYFVFLLIMRLLGKRMNAQLTITELGVMVMLGAIVSVPMQIPNRGLLPAVVLLGGVLFLQRGLNWWAVKRRRAEMLLLGKVVLLAKDGVLQMEALRRENVSHEQLFAQLRHEKITHLGQVRRVYMEADGSFSIFRQEPARAWVCCPPATTSCAPASPRPLSSRPAATAATWLSPPPTTPAATAPGASTSSG